MPLGLLWILPAYLGLHLVGAWLFWIFVFLNSVVIQAKTGYSMGHGIMGLQLVHLAEVGKYREQYAQKPTMGTLVLRQVAHIVDMATLYGWVRPMRHDQYRTFADSLADTIVVRSGSVDQEGNRYLTAKPQIQNRWTYP